MGPGFVTEIGLHSRSSESCSFRWRRGDGWGARTSFKNEPIRVFWLPWIGRTSTMNSEAVQPVLSPSGSSQMCCHLSKPAALLTYSVAFRQSVRWSTGPSTETSDIAFRISIHFSIMFFSMRALVLAIAAAGCKSMYSFNWQA